MVTLGISGFVTNINTYSFPCDEARELEGRGVSEIVREFEGRVEVRNR